MKRFLECCAEVEEVVALIYSELAAHANGNARLAAIMRKLAADEEDHARQLRFASRVSAKETFEGLSEKAGDPHTLKLRAEALLGQVREARQNEYALLKLAVELEKDFGSIHAGYALTFKDERMIKLFAALARGDEAHVAELKEYIEEFKQRAAPRP